MAKILSIIILIALIGGGGWYYTNKMMTPSEGTPVGYDSGRGRDKSDNNRGREEEDRYDNKLNNKSFVITFPKAGAILDVGQKINTTWNTSRIFNLKLTYPVVLINVTDKTKNPIPLGTAKNSLFNKVFVWTVPQDIIPGNSYKLVFLGKRGGESQSFIINTPEGIPATSTIPTISTEPINNLGPAIFSKVSSDITTIKNNNVDVGVSVNFRLNIQTKGSDIYASGTTAIVVLKDVVTGKTIETKIVEVTSLEPNLILYSEGVTKTANIQTIFPVSIFSSGGNNVNASIYSINYKTLGTLVKPSVIYTALDFSLYDTGITTITNTLTPTITGNKVIRPDIKKIFSNISIINSKDPYNQNNFSGIKTDIGLNFTAKGGDIFTKDITAVVGIKDKQTGNIIATTSVNVIPSESGLYVFQEGSQKVVYISAIFATSTLPLKNMIVSSFVQSITFYSNSPLDGFKLDYGLESLVSDSFVTNTR